jgi:hypothetical protein
MPEVGVDAVVLQRDVAPASCMRAEYISRRSVDHDEIDKS